MQYLKLDDNTYYNAAYVVSVIEGPYIGIRRQVSVSFSTPRDVKLVDMTAAMFLEKLQSGEAIIDVSAYYRRPY